MTTSGIRYLTILLLANACIGQNADCISKDYNNGGTVCVCNSDHCDIIPAVKKLEPPYYQVFTSTKDGLRFKRTQGTFETPNSYSFWPFDNIKVNRYKTYQKIFGFGGAFTDAFGINLRSLDENAQRKLMRSYFSEDGIEYNIGRVPIGGTDFSERGYSYCDTETEDRTLSKFNLTYEDHLYKIPYIQEAKKLSNNALQVFAAAWTAPKWMKTNGEYSGFGAIKRDMYDVWANYFIKFLDNYEKQNISFWGISTGNEPSLGLVGSKIPSNRWLPDEMIKWVAGYLGPTLRNSAYKNLKLMLLDDQRLFVPWFIDEVFQNKSVKDYVDIIAIHWYWDWVVPIKVLDIIHNNYPDKPIMGTEACIGDHIFEAHVKLGSWYRGERYASDIIKNLNHHYTSWTDWNMALNPEGGPTYIQNFVDSPIIVNATSGEFYKQPMYYALGHFSKFLSRDSIRIDLDEVTLIPMTGFLRPDDGVVLVLLNLFDWSRNVNIVDKTRGQISLTLEAHSITTILYY